MWGLCNGWSLVRFFGWVPVFLHCDLVTSHDRTPTRKGDCKRIDLLRGRRVSYGIVIFYLKYLYISQRPWSSTGRVMII